MKNKYPPILDATCGGRMMWFDKNNPNAIFCDARSEQFTKRFGSNNAERTIEVKPDVVSDFRNLPFPDEAFSLVVLDPPHIKGISGETWTAKAYGSLSEDWRDELRDGFNECMRVLKPLGTLVFKWSETQIPTREVIKAIGTDPLFGHRSGKKMNTHWMCFMKIPKEDL